MKSDIQKFFKGDVDDSNETLEKYSRDASIFSVRPKLVVYPKDAIDIEKLVEYVKENKKNDPTLSLTVRAAGTCMSGGALNESIIVDVMKYMNHVGEIKNIDPYSITPSFRGASPVTISGEITVEPGVFYRDLEKKTLEYDLLLPCFTASKSINAVGGMVGNNSGGELTLRYGKMEDYIKELKMVFTDGHEYTIKPLSRRELYKKIAEPTREGQIYKKIFDIVSENETTLRTARPLVNKNSAGYYLWNVWYKDEHGEEVFDLAKVVVGSQGTLGIVTSVTLRLVEKKPKSKLVLVMLRDLADLGNIVRDLLVLQPTTLESYDDKTFSLAMRYFSEFVKAKGLGGLVKYAFSFIPEFMMMLRGGVPKLMLLVEYEGNHDEELLKKAEETMAAMKKYAVRSRIIPTEKEAKKYWDMRRDSFALLRKHSGNRHTAPFIDDIIVPPEKLPEFLPKLNAILSRYSNLIYTIAGHAGNGNFHIIPLMDFGDAKTVPTILELSEKVYTLVLEYHGSIDAEHNDGIIRTPFLGMQFGPVVSGLFKETKDAFDPDLILNPGKKVGGDMVYLKDHIALDHPMTHGS